MLIIRLIFTKLSPDAPLKLFIWPSFPLQTSITSASNPVSAFPDRQSFLSLAFVSYDFIPTRTEKNKVDTVAEPTGTVLNVLFHENIESAQNHIQQTKAGAR